MSPVSFLQFQQAIYTHLPDKTSDELARKTVRQASIRSAYRFYQLLGDTVTLQRLPTEARRNYLQANGKLRYFTRLRLTFNHFINALLSRYQAFGAVFQTRLDQALSHKGNSSGRSGGGDGDSDIDLPDGLMDKIKQFFGKSKGKSSAKHQDSDHDYDTDSDDSFDFDD